MSPNIFVVFGGCMFKFCIKVITVFITLFGLCSCQSTTSQLSDNTVLKTELFVDNSFNGYEEYPIESEGDVFSLDDDMKAMVDEKLLRTKNIKKRAKKLLAHIFSKDNINLAYQSTANLTASQTFHSQQANCMSLTIMAYALASYAGLDVKFQSIKVPEYWIRNGEYNMLTGHVNLMLTEPKDPNKPIVYGREILQIDFDPAMNRKAFPKRVIDKNMVLAMFYNNKAADAIVEHEYPKAYAYLKSAIKKAPGYSSAWGNLGILYKLVGLGDYAIDAYDYSISLDKDNLTALGNLSYLFEARGNIRRANEIKTLLHNKRVKNPYYHALLADEAYYNGDNELALKHYQRAIRMNRKVHEFYFGLAKVQYALNNIISAERAMNKALAHNKGTRIESLYLAKLNFLKQAEVHH